MGKFRSLKISSKIIFVVLILLIVFRLFLPSIVKNYVNKKINALPGYTGHVQDIDINLYRGAYVIKGLLLRKKTDPVKHPFLAIDQADLSIEWRAIFKGRLVGQVILIHPDINILATEDLSKEPSKESWTKTVKALMPITINQLQVRNGKFTYLDLQKKPYTNLHLDQLELTAHNLANVQKTGSPLPSKVSLTGISSGNGHLKANMDVNVLKDVPDFDTNLSLIGVNLLSLNGFLESHVKFDIERGSIDIYSHLKVKDSEMNGYVKPFIKNLKVLDVKKDIKKKGGVLRVVKKAVVGLFAKAVENPKTKKIATLVPIQGNLKDPKTSGWKTFLGILKNAFIKAFHEGLEGAYANKSPTI